ncbi:hypothetical protein A6R68_00834 [Neotoma lepida]|uniref:Uncharacterized protein n=1 Tax=Neotoma lepida TaxID=56216 RepID=A0A1A6GZ57_NEOLE|nr:hypothetical protein A6R68_00834 [Neotoma lepida]
MLKGPEAAAGVAEGGIYTLNIALLVSEEMVLRRSERKDPSWDRPDALARMQKPKLKTALLHTLHRLADQRAVRRVRQEGPTHAPR